MHIQSSYRFKGKRFASYLLILLTLTGCYPASGEDVGADCRQYSLKSSRNPALGLPDADSGHPLLLRTWLSYRDRFILPDGRVVDLEADNRTTSEGQAYAMLRAVMINDRQTFERTLTWAERNLSREQDQLWAWHWGEAEEGQWRILDANFATDADVDAVTALILAARRWQCPEYLDLAKAKLDDIWALGTAAVTLDERYLLPGPAAAFWQTPDTLILNPSYFAPSSFRLFAQVDPDRDWMSLVDSSYTLLNGSVKASTVSLPSDWIQINLKTGDFSPLPTDSLIQTRYSFDAFRVWWRIALDASWFQEPRAEQFLTQNLTHLRDRWLADQSIPAVISLEGQALVDYEATSQYAMLYPAFKVTSPLLAQQIYQKKLLPNYEKGYWDNDTAYYSQNLAWFALLPQDGPTSLLEPDQRL